MPGMYAVTSMPVVSRTRATLRKAEFGFFGVVVKTRVQTPRRWGDPFRAGVFDLSDLVSRPLRTSWAIVGTGLLKRFGLGGSVRAVLVRLDRSPVARARNVPPARPGTQSRPPRLHKGGRTVPAVATPLRRAPPGRCPRRHRPPFPAPGRPPPRGAAGEPRARGPRARPRTPWPE